jgi:hypothetical protein
MLCYIWNKKPVVILNSHRLRHRFVQITQLQILTQSISHHSNILLARAVLYRCTISGVNTINMNGLLEVKRTRTSDNMKLTKYTQNKKNSYFSLYLTEYIMTSMPNVTSLSAIPVACFWHLILLFTQDITELLGHSIFHLNWHWVELADAHLF